MNDLNIHYWSHGPHYQFRDSIVFITWRLAGTLPSHILKLFQQLTSENDDKARTCELRRIKQENVRLFRLYQDYDLELAKWSAPGFSLNEDRFAKIITGAFHYYDSKKYELHSYCVMSNHVHLLIRALPNENGSIYHISEIIRLLKSYTAHEIDKTINQTGQLWDAFHFDRIIRDERNYANVINYIMYNPVTAGLVDSPDKWRDSYCNPEFASFK